MQEFPTATGYSEGIAARLVDVARAFQDEADLTDTPRRHQDLIRSGIPRPYQLEAYAVFRGYGYDAVVVEAPTGSGKTLIGMMCIQDWLRALPRGRTILVVVPTTNYQQQWVGELCYNPLGLELSPELVFAGTPTGLDRYQRQTTDFPAVTVLTYTALAQMSMENDVFNPDVVREYLSNERIEYVMLDEAHKVVEDLDSASAQVIKVATAAYRDGDLRGVVGFTGTASAYRSRFELLCWGCGWYTSSRRSN
jgi:superfamily II DNA or RNA helicase